MVIAQGDIIIPPAKASTGLLRRIATAGRGTPWVAQGVPDPGIGRRFPETPLTRNTGTPAQAGIQNGVALYRRIIGK